MLFLEDIKLLTLHFNNGIKILPYIRYELMCYLNNENESNISNKRPKPLTKLQIACKLLKSIRKAIIKQKDILFFSTTVLNIKDKNDNYYNLLDGYYYNLYPSNSLLIEDADTNFSWRTKESYENLSFINTYLIYLAQVLSSLMNKIYIKKNKDFQYLIEKYPALYNKKKLSYLEYFTTIYSYFIRFLLKKTKCRVLFCNCASYGGHYSLIIKTANDLGIKTIELQHGTIVKEHLAYNADIFIVNDPEYQKYLPHELWTFGKYWENNTNWLYDKISVGYPLLNKYASYGNVSLNIVDFLIISQPNLNNIIIEFTTKLAEQYPDKSIKVRLHPMDNYDLFQEELGKINNIIISKGHNILYEDIKQSNIIIGVYSTCLYEALAFKKTPHIIDCELSRRYFSKDVGIWVKEAKEIKLINSIPQKEINYSIYWEKNDKNKIKQILGQYVGYKN